MKLDNNDHLNFHITPPRKSYNPFDSDDETCDSNGLKAGNLFVKEDVSGFEPLTFDKNSDTISFHLDNGDFLWEEAMPTTLPSSVTTDQAAVHANGAHAVDEPVPVKEGHVYTDKTVTECELPEVVVCYKESSNNNQSVKDIGIDEGVLVPSSPSYNNKMWNQSGEEESSKEDPCEFVDLDKLCIRSDTNLKIETRNSVDDVKSSESTALSDDDNQKKSEDSKKDDTSTHQLGSGQYLVHEFGAADDESMEMSQLKLELDNNRAASSLSSRSPTMDASVPGNSVKENHMFSATLLGTPEVDDCSRPSEPVIESQYEILNPGDAMEKKEDVPSGAKSPDQITLLPVDLGVKDSLPGEPSTVSSQEEIQPKESKFLEQESHSSAQPSDHSTRQEESIEEESNPSKLTYNSKLESASITFDFGNTSSGAEKEEGTIQNSSECSKPPDTQAMTRQGDEGAAASSSSDNTFSSILERRVVGETSFSQAAPSSITFTGPVSYSGSISLRSESSAGSTRSFAFPVLQTEWNSSPVRMAKADQRNLKKQRGWVQAVICCKF